MDDLHGEDGSGDMSVVIHSTVSIVCLLLFCCCCWLLLAAVVILVSRLSSSGVCMLARVVQGDSALWTELDGH